MARVKCDLHNNYTEKALHGQFAHDVTNLVDTKYQWKWLQCSGISRQVEALPKNRPSLPRREILAKKMFLLFVICVGSVMKQYII